MTEAALYSSRVDEALRFTAEAFRYRRRKGSDIPYLTHLLEVMVIVAEHGGDEDQLIAALLHDYLEDIPTALGSQVSDRFGPRVLSLVEQLSEPLTRPKLPWKERKLRYIARMKTAPVEVRLISAADKTHNASSLRKDLERTGASVWARFTASPDETLWFYRTVVEALGEGWSHTLLNTLAAEVNALHKVAERIK